MKIWRDYLEAAELFSNGSRHFLIGMTYSYTGRVTSFLRSIILFADHTVIIFCSCKLKCQQLNILKSCQAIHLQAISLRSRLSALWTK